eukprot:scaffold200219_cov24-Tisochrysis_lutea.AAC.1
MALCKETNMQSRRGGPGGRRRERSIADATKSKKASKPRTSTRRCALIKLPKGGNPRSKIKTVQELSTPIFRKPTSRIPSK